jgi:CheY-like chemotaxis protein
MIRVLLAEDQDMVRGALAALLSLEEDIEVVAEVDRGDEIVGAAQRTWPHIALLDIEMPGLDGITAAAALREALPECRVLILTTFGRPGFLRRAMAEGASGFLLKDAPADELAVAIRRTPRARGAAGLRGRGQRGPGGAAPVPVRGHGPQPPLGCDPEAGGEEPRGGGTDRGGAGLALSDR